MMLDKENLASQPKAMESEESYANGLILSSQSQFDTMDPKRARFPCCIVWTPIPVISWLIPFIGHIGICREDGVILDFAGPNFVSVDNFAFGAVTRYVQCSKPSKSNKSMTWDEALRRSTQEFQHRSYNLFTRNCHSFVANNLNRLMYDGHGWNVVNIAALIFLKGTWVSKKAFLKSYLPFVVVFLIGFLLGGLNFLMVVITVATVLVGWFLIGTYCLKSLIEL